MTAVAEELELITFIGGMVVMIACELDQAHGSLAGKMIPLRASPLRDYYSSRSPCHYEPSSYIAAAKSSLRKWAYLGFLYLGEGE
jgi:hypothetical protein